MQNKVDFQVETLAQAVIRIKSNLRPPINDIGKDLFPDGGPTSKRLIEITGESFTGKSLLLLEIIARCILPVDYGGKEASVIFLDLDNKFSMAQFLNILEKNVTTISTTENTCNNHHRSCESKDVAEICLKRLQIFNCYNSDELMLALMKIDKNLFVDQDISVIAIDSISSFYWMDCEEQNIKMESHYKELATKFKCLCMEYSICVVYTQPMFYGNKQKSSLADYKFGLYQVDHQVYQLRLNMFGDKYEKFYMIDANGIRFPLDDDSATN